MDESFKTAYQKKPLKIYYDLPGEYTVDNKEQMNALILLYEKGKYHLMWILRFLEKEIREEGGMIVLWFDGEKTGAKTGGFSPGLIKKIEDAIKDINVYPDFY